MKSSAQIITFLKAKSTYGSMPLEPAETRPRSNFPVFWALKVMHFDLMTNNMAAPNNQRVVQIDFKFLSALLSKEGIPFQSELNIFSTLLLNS